MDQQLLAKIAQIFEQLQCRLSLLDEGGACLVPHDDTLRPLPDITDENTIATMFGARYLRVPKAGCLLSAPEGTPDDVLRMAKNLIEALVQLSATSGGIGSAYQRILLNELSVAELDAAISEYRIPAQLSRCVLLLHMIQVQGRSARDILSEVIPMSPNDVLIAMDNHTAALIKCTAGMDELEDLKQFAAALQETVQEETGLPLTVGIGDIAQNAGELHQSYRQARRAI